MNFNEVIKRISEDKRVVPDLMKSEKGNNFRAVSESAILDVVDPILKEAGIFYTVDVREQHLDIREAYGKNGKKLQFIATITLSLWFRTETGILFKTDSVGMGIDDNDKAMGKAYTYAVKYALLKVFRLRYADDPDFKASEDLLIDKPKKAEEPKQEKTPAKPKKESKKEQMMTEAQRDFILGLMEQKGISENTVIGKFRVEPSMDEDIPMKVARAIIEWLQQQDDLPF